MKELSSKKSLENYIDLHTEKESDLLKQINRTTHLHMLHPNMIAGQVQGRVLSLLSHIVSPKDILEIGTFTGYSALCLSEGLQPNGKLISIEVNEEYYETSKRLISQAENDKKIELILGNALDIIPTLRQHWDMVLIDADKKNYTNYYKLVIEKLNPNGIIIVDNVLWGKKVMDNTQQDKKTIALRQFNEMVHQDERVQNVLFNIRDGLMVLRKK